MPMRLNSVKYPDRVFVEYDDDKVNKFKELYGREWLDEILIIMSHELVSKETDIEQPDLINSEPTDPMAGLYNIKIERF